MDVIFFFDFIMFRDLLLIFFRRGDFAEKTRSLFERVFLLAFLSLSKSLNLSLHELTFFFFRGKTYSGEAKTKEDASRGRRRRRRSAGRTIYIYRRHIKNVR